MLKRTDELFFITKSFYPVIFFCILCNFAFCETENIEDFTGLYWNWYPEKTNVLVSAPAGKYYLRHKFEIPQDRDIQRAFMLVSVDNSCIVFLNGEECGFASQWGEIKRIPLKRYIKTGNNLIAIEAENAGPNDSPAGIVGKIVIKYKDDTIDIIPIDKKWKISKEKYEGWKEFTFNADDWKNAEPVTLFGLGPWGDISKGKKNIPGDFPVFIVPGYENEFDLLRHLFYTFYGTGTGGTLWDGWIVKSTIWPAGSAAEMLKRNHSRMLSSRIMDNEGYISCHQHKGLAHNLGWPFPLWTQSGGIGWHFSVFGLPYDSRFGVFKTTTVENWKLTNVEDSKLDSRGWHLNLSGPAASITTPQFNINSFISPFIALELGPANIDKSAVCFLEWKTEESPHFSGNNRIYFDLSNDNPAGSYIMIPVYKTDSWKGKIIQLRFNFKDIEETSLTIRKIYTSVDSRHNINNSCYLQGCLDYINWTGDLNFLRQNIQKMRSALRYAVDEFQVEKYKCVYTPWVGHDGRSGIEREEGNKTIHLGRGIGNNYWDLLPAGGKDTIATVYLYDVLAGMAELEKAIKTNPQWNIPSGHLSFNSDNLLSLSRQIKDYSNRAFWNDQTDRYYMATDINGKSYDYGFTILNLEAVYYDFAADSQARSILDWISGKRTVPGDTSKGRDIYHWVFSPRSTTKRNLEYYAFVWPEPENLSWGDQVQDGGAVLGFSYFDIMSRLKVYGPDNAWQRLKEIIQWYKEVQAEGGFRKYYSKPGRGSLQGGGTAGGLGIDMEFAESVLVPQVMIYGFMGIEPRLDRLTVKPKLPADWTSLKIEKISYGSTVFDITADENLITLEIQSTRKGKLYIELPQGKWRIISQKNDSELYKSNININENVNSAAVEISTGCIVKFSRVEPGNQDTY